MTTVLVLCIIGGILLLPLFIMLIQLFLELLRDIWHGYWETSGTGLVFCSLLGIVVLVAALVAYMRPAH